MNILHVTDNAFTDRCWQAYYALMEALYDRYQTPMARIGWEQTKQKFLSLAESDPNYHQFVAFDEQTAVGWADFRVFAPGTDGQCASIRVESVDEGVSGEFERMVAAEFLHLMEKQKLNSVHVMAVTEDVSAIARRWHGNELNRLDRFRLYRAKAQTLRMKSWLDRIPRDNPDLRQRFFSPVPDEFLDAYTELYVRFIREMPTERESEKPFEMTVEEVKRDIEWRRKNKMRIYTYALFDADGTMVGHSNALINEADPSDAYQAMTGVISEYRRRGLSRWLKAALFFKVGEDFPANETMTTVMRAANAPIQKVNAEMGFVLLSSGHEFDLSAAGFRRSLER